VEANLPQPVEKEIVPPVVRRMAGTGTELHGARRVAAKREEVRTKAANLITQKLAADGIVVKEVMLRDIQLPRNMRRAGDLTTQGAGKRPDGR